MYEKLLVPLDDSDAAQDVYEDALDLAERHDATVYVLNVADTSQHSLTTTEQGVRDVLVDRGQDIVDDAVERADARGVDAVGAVRQGTPAETIVALAENEAVDLVVMPTHGRTGVARFFLGSVAERVVRQSEVPVLTVRPSIAITASPETILVPTDGSDPADAALRRAVDVAATTGATIHLLYVVDTASLGLDVSSGVDTDRLEARGEEVLDDARAVVEDAGVAVSTTIEFGSPHRDIVDYVEDAGVDLLVMGTHGLTGLDRYLLGSVTEKVLRTSPVPVLTVHGEREDGPADD